MPSDEEALKLAAPLVITDQSKANKLALEAYQAARAAFRREQPPRPAQIPDEIDKVITDLKERSTIGGFAIPEAIWSYLGQEDLASVWESYRDREDLLTELDDARELAESMPERDFDRRGGRSRDPRMDRFAISLSLIYSRYSGKRPTLRFIEGDIVSEFGKFGEIAFETFCPVKPTPFGTVRGALQQAVCFYRGTEEMPPDQVKSLLPEHSSDSD